MSGSVDVLNKAATYASHAAIAAERIGNGEVEDMDGVRRAFLRIAAGLSGAPAASAAVAELIEECERLCDVADGMKRNADGMSRKSPIALTLRTAAANILSLRNALARVGGAA